MSRIAILFISALLLQSCNGFSQKINGVNFEAPPKEIDDSWTQGIKEVNGNFVSIVPFGFSRAGSTSLGFDYPRQWWGESVEGSMETVRMAKKAGMGVMLKPHVWIGGGVWVGDFNLDSPEDWESWEADYSKYILTYANEAQKENVEILCIGTELKTSVRERPQYWLSLINEVRAVYDGKLTYCSNWDNVNNIPFWKELDYIGISAYYPLSELDTPSINILEKAWEPIKSEMKSFSEKIGRKVLFTEYGYRSVNPPAWKSWKIEYSKYDESHFNYVGQVNAYQALFSTFWDEPWIAGGFLWKWYSPGRLKGPNSDWTPQNKPVEKVIKLWYGK